ncbi:PREDICTED: transmembrane protein 68-like [Thamnophis sirtalis]|uniref:Transmembrane protein 68-like n=1 Tax=Thamnophis sirtalis TaxID=35019 RepID=A0A6I9X7A5_9SAUR|nr:PREDICTED: transmembrane protein 68-like [Thamnophis sirtalis]
MVGTNLLRVLYDTMDFEELVSTSILHGAPSILTSIIPTFTQNIRENIRIVGGQIKLLRWIYEYIRLPIFPLYGNFPGKLQIYFGDPIPYDPNTTAEELAKKVKNALRCLIDKHQKIPGNVWRALMA